MAQKPETLFKNRVRKDLKALPDCWFAKIQQVGINGTPDILACVGGHFVALELKARDIDKETALQRYNIEKIKKAGGYAIVTHPGDWPEVYKILEGLTKKQRT